MTFCSSASQLVAIRAAAVTCPREGVTVEGDDAPPGPAGSPPAADVRLRPGGEPCGPRCSRGRAPTRTSSRSPTSTTCRCGESSTLAWPDVGRARRCAPGWRSAASRRRGGTRSTPRSWPRDGRHVVVATGTASGKSLAYQLPGADPAGRGPARLRALPRADEGPGRATSCASVAALADPSVRPAAYDGDTPGEERDWVRRHSRWIVTNPDMLHRGILPAHQKWSSTLRRVAYVVIDECHAYRGVFGSHVGHVLRRLRRICRRYGAEPVFVLASATVADPAAAASPAGRRTGRGGHRGRLARGPARPSRCGSRR